VNHKLVLWGINRHKKSRFVGEPTKESACRKQESPAFRRAILSTLNVRDSFYHDGNVIVRSHLVGSQGTKKLSCRAEFGRAKQDPRVSLQHRFIYGT